MLTREEWDEFCERSIAVLLLAAVVFNAVFFGGVRNPEFGFAVVLALLVWMVRLWVAPAYRLLIHPSFFPLLGFAAYAVWRARHVTVPYLADREVLGVAITILVFVIGLTNLHRQDAARWLSQTLAALGCLIAGYAVLQLLRESDSILWLQQPASYSHRAGGTFVNPNHLAGFLAALIPISLSVVFLGRESAVVKILHAYAAMVMLAGVAVTMSRGGWAAAMVGIFLLFGYILSRQPSLRWPAAVTGLIVGVIAVAYIASVDKAYSRIVNLSAEGNVDAGASRLWLWRPAVAMWQDHPWTGVGPAHFDVEFPAYRPWQIQLHPGYTHNEYLGLLVDYGIIGALFLLVGGIFFVAGVARSTRQMERGVADFTQRRSNRSALFFGAAAGLGALAFHCLVDFDIHIPAISVLGALLGGFLAAHLRWVTPSVWIQPGWLGRMGLTLVGCGLLAWLTWQLTVFGTEAYHLNQAAMAGGVDAHLMGHLSSAATIAPGNPRTAFELGENLRRISFQGDTDWKTNGLESIRWLERSVALNPRDAEARLALARIRHWMGDKKGANQDFDQALAIGTNSVEVANFVAWNRLTRGQTNEAKALLDQSVKWNWYSNPMAISMKADLEAKGYR